jgi:hypothetical protein
MANGNGPSIEHMHQEIERLGSIVRSLSTQIASMRIRVSDIEEWDRSLMAAGRGKGKTKKKTKRKKKTKKKNRRYHASNGNGGGY